MAPLDFGRLAEDARNTARQAGPPSRLHSLSDDDWRDYVQYLIWSRRFSRDSWGWHLLSTEFLFGVVVAIVIGGLLLTVLQFRRSYGDWRPSSPPQTGEGAAPREEGRAGSPTSIKIGPAGLEVTSQVIGLLVLTVSLVFFYLYVKEVYPMQISELGLVPPNTPTTQRPVADGAGSPTTSAPLDFRRLAEEARQTGAASAGSGAQAR